MGVTKIGQIPLDKQTLAWKQICSSYLRCIVVPDECDHSTRLETFLLGAKEVGNIAGRGNKASLATS